ncbi:MAG TPA: peptidoglycan DD-metalloendopeptidase family protein [Casimicrobiaceae bacterium]
MRSPSPFPLTPHFRSLFALLVIALLAAGCATRRPAPVEDRALTRSQPPAIAASSAPAAEPPPVATYTVKRGDTLHQIALDSGLDYRDLAAWNNIENVNRIYPGQVLRLVAPGQPPAPVQTEMATGVTTAPLRSVPAIGESKPPGAPPASAAPLPAGAATAPGAHPSASAASAPAYGAVLVKTSPKAIKEPYSEQAVRELTLAASAVPAPPDALAMAAPGGVRSDARPELQSSAAPAASAAAPTPAPQAMPGAAQPPPSAPAAAAASKSGDADDLDWAWPAKGKIIAGFSETANLKGIDIAGTAGEPVRASAPGRVVYAGSGLRGYGKLIIIKHNATFLSAYAHNREILVKEGQQVTRGQKIAEMGNTDATQVKLHFEIRRYGKPMDPARYLPPA